MPDIAMCYGSIGAKICPLKDQCYRHTAERDEYQSIFAELPLKEDGSCEYFWDNKEYPPEGVFHIKTENS
jgi:hypothetical protein